ncbi:MAG TPA: hypothetical protein VGO80_10695 [Solirubrobacteraceae bacterium]|jgi:hypothetical protein|nr:hypothetical protein [Solirubrobacteraceae bacterium]
MGRERVVAGSISAKRASGVVRGRPARSIRALPTVVNVGWRAARPRGGGKGVWVLAD